MDNMFINRKKINLIQKLKLPHGILYLLFVSGLISLLFPYLYGSDNTDIMNLFKIIGPLITLFSVFASIPVWQEKIVSQETKNKYLKSSGKNIKTEFSGTKSERFIDDGPELNLQSNNGKEEIVTCILRKDLEPEDVVYVKTENSVYKIQYAHNEYYKVSGGWFSKGGRSGYELKITGCVNKSRDKSSRKKIHRDYIASCNKCIKFGNNLITSPVKKITLRKNDAD